MRWFKGLAGLSVIAVGLIQASGCFNSAGDCDLNPKLACGRFANTAGTGGSTSSSSTGGGGGTGGMPPDCTGDPNTENVIEACGVFVQADAKGSTEDGTEAHPYKSLQKAIDNSGTKRVYACASAPYTESVTVSAPVEVYGGFACSKAWTWSSSGRSALNGTAEAVPLTLTKQADGTKIQGFAITSAAAVKKGDSSVAVAVDDIVAALISCEVTAGDGMPGDDGVAPSGIATKGTDGMPPDAVTMNACINGASMLLVGGSPGTLTCDDGMTAGGQGGKGGLIVAMSIEDGKPGADGTMADAVNGIGGAGESMAKCLPGVPGKDGADGAPGDAGSLAGALSLKGVSDANMTDGKPGARGNGGGGGGGAKSGLLLCAGGVDGNGASGGGGGAGGCGGKGGGGGRAGGSSIAIVSMGTKFKLTQVTLTTGKGGAGGKGVGGQAGGLVGFGSAGGAPSGGVKAGCKGGDGGSGGLGGPGGGGRGGHSVGIAYATAPAGTPTLKGFTGGMEGLGGTAAPGNTTGNGSNGAKGACWDFGKNASCGP